MCSWCVVLNSLGLMARQKRNRRQQKRSRDSFNLLLRTSAVEVLVCGFDFLGGGILGKYRAFITQPCYFLGFRV